jgi:hypothetical protein
MTPQVQDCLNLMLLANYVANFLPTLHVIRHGEGSNICVFCQKLPTANKTTTNLMPPKKKKRKDVVTATAAAADAAAAPADAVRKDVAAQLTGTHRDAIAEVVRYLHCTPCPNTHPDIARMTPADIIDTFWNEFKSFQQCTHPFAEPSRWATADVTQGNSFLWHENDSV